MINSATHQKEVWIGLYLDYMAELKLKVVESGERFVMVMFQESRELHSDPYKVKVQVDNIVKLFDEERIKEILESF